MKLVNLKSKTELISDEIVSYIIQNDLKAGDKIPNEYDIATILGVGRGTVREGVRELISRNILHIKRGDGTYVSEKQGVLNDPLGLSLIGDKTKLAKDMLDIRFLIEPYIAAQAATMANDANKISIERLCNEVEILIRQGKNHLDKDVEFHKAIAESCGNSVMPRLIPVINQSIYLFGNVTKMQLAEVTITTHREVVDAIKKGDSKAAYDAMYLHLVYNRRAINRVIDSGC